MREQYLETNQNQRVLLLEDDFNLASLIQVYLSKEGFQVVINDTGEGAVADILSAQYDLVILDINLPYMSGMEICKQARLGYSGPIIMFTALDDDMDQMLGLELGADDYIIKPVQPRLLLTRIRALLRRLPDPHSGVDFSAHQDSVIQAGPLQVNAHNRSVMLGGTYIDLTSTEFDLLVMLAAEAGNIVDRELMVQRLRGFEYDGIDRSIDRRISRLRKKLQAHTKGADMIKTIRGRGYQLCLDTLNN